MESSQFDTLARSIGKLRSRRTVVAALVSSALGGTLRLGHREAAAAPKPADAKCSSDTQCASGTCLKYGKCKKHGKLTGKCRCACAEDTECGTGRICRERACFSQCLTGGTCGAFQPCSSGTCGCFTSTDADVVCVFTGPNTCLTDACTTEADCPDGYVCGIIQPTGVDDCCEGKERTCMAPCQAKSVQPVTAAASRDGQGGSGHGQIIAGH
jgi:hypothetical protein